MSTDGDAELQIYTVDEYFFRGSKNKKNHQLVCFSILPLRFGDATIVPQSNNRALYLSGRTNGALRLHREVVAWRLELGGEQPRFLLLAPADGGGAWLRLAKPCKLYERTARTVLMTAQVLHFLRRNPDGPETALWTHLRQVFGNFRRGPSEDDFLNQTSLSLMRQFAIMDPVLANSEALRAFVERISTEVGGADIIGIADEYSFHAKDNYKLVCFSTLPLRFGDAAADVPKGNKALYLTGFTVGGHRLWKKVVAWRLELDGEQPRFLVLTQDRDGVGWLRLAEPKKTYYDTARTVLMTAQVLHFLKRNPDGPKTALWIHLHQVFGKIWPTMPSEDDFRNQTSLSLMRQFASMDPILANSEALRAFVERISTEVGGADIVGIANDYSFRAKDNYKPVCFSTLPWLQFGAAAADVPEGKKALYLSGCSNSGLRLLKEVVAWRLELDGEQPRFLVLVNGDGIGWLRLVKPMKIYEDTTKTVLMTAQVLHFLRRNPDGPKAALWIHLHQVFGKIWPTMPSEDDFRNQTSLSLMRQFASMDPILANSEALRAFVERISTEVGGDANIIDMADDGDANIFDMADDGEIINEFLC